MADWTKKYSDMLNRVGQGISKLSQAAKQVGPAINRSSIAPKIVSTFNAMPQLGNTINNSRIAPTIVKKANLAGQSVEPFIHGITKGVSSKPIMQKLTGFQTRAPVDRPSQIVSSAGSFATDMALTQGLAKPYSKLLGKGITQTTSLLSKVAPTGAKGLLAKGLSSGIQGMPYTLGYGTLTGLKSAARGEKPKDLGKQLGSDFAFDVALGTLPAGLVISKLRKTGAGEKAVSGIVKKLGKEADEVANLLEFSKNYHTYSPEEQAFVGGEINKFLKKKMEWTVNQIVYGSREAKEAALNDYHAAKIDDLSGEIKRSGLATYIQDKATGRLGGRKKITQMGFMGGTVDTKGIPEVGGIDALKAEARKYKSAEGFISDYGKVPREITKGKPVFGALGEYTSKGKIKVNPKGLTSEEIKEVIGHEQRHAVSDKVMGYFMKYGPSGFDKELNRVEKVIKGMPRVVGVETEGEVDAQILEQFTYNNREFSQKLPELNKYLTDYFNLRKRAISIPNLTDFYNQSKLPEVGGVKEIQTPLQPTTELLQSQPSKILSQGEVYHAVPDKARQVKLNAKSAEKQAQQEFKEYQAALFKQEAPRTVTGAVGDISKSIGGTTVSPAARNVEQLKDISGFTGQARDVYRNFKAVFGKRYDEVKRTLLDPFDQAKGANIDMQETWLKDLRENVVNKLGIKVGSENSRLTQLYGEGQISLETLSKKAPKDWEKIVQADNWFRNAYNTLLDQTNEVRARIYPNDPSKIIPKRQDYYRHFRELKEGIGGLVGIFEGPSGISSNLSGLSEFTKPKSKFLSFAQQRLGQQSEVDAVAGFLNYLPSATYAQNIDPFVGRFRSLADELAAQTAEGPNVGKLNNFIEFLQDYANDLSGKTSSADRFVQKVIPGGRRAFAALNWLNNRVKSNTIILNASSSIAQLFNIPQGIASAGLEASMKGVGKSLASIFQDIPDMVKSNFLKERYFKGYDEFDKGMLKDVKRFGKWMVTVGDEIGTKFIWNAHYERALAEGNPNPIKYADDITRELVAGRGIGEVPLLQKSKVFQLVAPFQLEVGNLWWVMKDMVSEKKFSKLAALFIGNYMFNRAAEEIRGSGVTFDPIQAMIEAASTYQEEEDKKQGLIKAGGRLGGEILSNLPLGQSLASAYPEYGMKDIGLPTRKEFFGREDPTRFGSGLLSMKALQDPLYKIAMPFGGSQVKKTVEGISSYDKGFVGPEDKIKFPVEKNAVNAIKSTLFGQYGTSEAKEYFDEGRSPLGSKQSEDFLKGNKTYEQIMQERAKRSEATKNKGKEEAGLVGEVGAAETSPIEDQKDREASLMETYRKLGGGAGLVGDKLIWLNDKGEKQSVDFNKYSTTKTGWDKFTVDAQRSSDARAIYKSPASPEQKAFIYKKLGVKEEDVAYDVAANYTTTAKVAYYTEQSQSMNHDAFVDSLVEGRKQSVSGKYLVNEGTLTELRDAGLISYDEWKVLKDVKIDNSGEIIKKASVAKSTTKTKKAKKPKKMKFPAMPKMKVPKIEQAKPIKIKRKKIVKRKLKKIKLAAPAVDTKLKRK